MRTPAILLTALFLLTAGVAPAAATATATPGDVGGADAPALSQYECSFPFSATDATGTEVTLEEAPETVTTLGPSAAQTMWEIGARDQVVGLDQFSTYLAGAESRTNVSASGFGYSTEAVVGTEADLVLAANVAPNDTIAQLRNAGMTVFKFEAATSIEDVANKTALTGALTGNCEEAARTNEWMMQNVDTAREATSDAETPRVLAPLGSGYVVGGGTFIDAVITASGGENVAARNHTGYPSLSDELILELDPEILVLQPWMTMTGVAEQEPYASTTAGENNATVVVNANYLNQPAPRSVVYATRNLTEAFQPDAYASAEWTARSEVTLETATPTPESQTEPTGTEMTTATATEPMATESPTSTDGPGFGIGAAIAALAGLSVLLTRRE
ncbi:PGF-CTERM-anchored ABC transporter substrate-binding protein [Halolamina sp.]|jgi:iron complex transport system substrate-binding protein|uniref:PGF-CTERM-anchored ABC transporter substrate-binding protein n=1 Tax=Halolamina sp. TaxID=1940283 RepID=UPI000223B893|nr:ABC-type transporter, periplasmic subunit [halophilic archaeon DL31]